VSTSNCEKQEKEEKKTNLVEIDEEKKLTGQNEEKNPAANENIPEFGEG
jgi:hypothetical protein